MYVLLTFALLMGALVQITSANNRSNAEILFQKLACKGTENAQLFEDLNKCALGFTPIQKIALNAKLEGTIKNICAITKSVITMSADNEFKPKVRRKKIHHIGQLDTLIRSSLLQAGMNPKIQTGNIKLELSSVKQKLPTAPKQKKPATPKPVVRRKKIIESGAMDTDFRRALLEAGMDPEIEEADIEFEIESKHELSAAKTVDPGVQTSSSQKNSAIKVEGKKQADMPVNKQTKNPITDDSRSNTDEKEHGIFDKPPSKKQSGGSQNVRQKIKNILQPEEHAKSKPIGEAKVLQPGEHVQSKPNAATDAKLFQNIFPNKGIFLPDDGKSLQQTVPKILKGKNQDENQDLIGNIPLNIGILGSVGNDIIKEAMGGLGADVFLKTNDILSQAMKDMVNTVPNANDAVSISVAVSDGKPVVASSSSFANPDGKSTSSVVKTAEGSVESEERIGAAALIDADITDTPGLHESTPLSIVNKKVSHSGEMDPELRKSLLQAGMDPNTKNGKLAFEVTSVKRKMLGENEQDPGALTEKDIKQVLNQKEPDVGHNDNDQQPKKAASTKKPSSRRTKDNQSLLTRLLDNRRKPSGLGQVIGTVVKPLLTVARFLAPDISIIRKKREYITKHNRNQIKITEAEIDRLKMKQFEECMKMVDQKYN